MKKILLKKTMLFVLFCTSIVSCGRVTDKSASIGTDVLTTTITIKEKEIVITTEVSATTSSSSLNSRTISTGEFSTTTSSASKLSAEERELLEKFYAYLFGETSEEYYAWRQETIDSLEKGAETLSEGVRGCITSEEEAIDKGKTVMVELCGQKFMDSIGADYVDINGEKVELIRDAPPIVADYYEEFDFWTVSAVPPSGKTVDGHTIVTPGEPPYVIIRGSDGKVFGVWF